MRKSIIIITLVVTNCYILLGQHLITVEQMYDDIDSCIDAYIKVHPEPYYFSTEDHFETIIEQLKNDIIHPMSQAEFYIYLSRLNYLFDSHSGILMPESVVHDVRKINKLFLNDIINFDNGIFHINNHFDPRYQNNEILTINDIQTTKIISELKMRISQEGEYWAEEQINKTWPIYFSSIYGIQDSVKIKFRNNNEEHSIVYRTCDISAWAECYRTKNNIQRVKPFNYYFYPELNIALFEFNSFSTQYYQSFIEDLADAFNYLNDVGISNLFVDISQNTGGDDSFWMSFFNYIEAIPKQYIAYSYDTRETTNNSLVINKCYNNTTYQGKLYLIQSNKTYSSAVSMSSIFKHYNLGRVIGEETGGLCGSFINSSYKVTLPNSKIQFRISTKKQTEVVGEWNGRGVIPDTNFNIGWEYSYNSFSIIDLLNLL